METLPYPISSSKFKSLLPTRKTITRFNSSKPILFHQPFQSHSLCFFKSFNFPPRNFPSLQFSTQSVNHSHGDDHAPQHHDHVEHQHQHHPHHHHHHHCCDSAAELSGLQKSIVEFAKAVKWIDLANFLREHLFLCCCSAALFLSAAVCPYFMPKPFVKPLQITFMLIAFPLVAVSASLDALIDIVVEKLTFM